jgi:hypothetical protein
LTAPAQYIIIDDDAATEAPRDHRPRGQAVLIFARGILLEEVCGDDPLRKSV